MRGTMHLLHRPASGRMPVRTARRGATKGHETQRSNFPVHWTQIDSEAENALRA